MQPTPEELRELILYVPETGKLYWRSRDIKWFNGAKPEVTQKNWNARYSGKEAFCKNRDGYRIGELFGKHQSAHIIAWAIHTGKWPENIIDHQNGIRHDNRFDNLEDVTIAKNNQNRCIHKTNKSGCSGVHWNSKNERWVATIFHNSKRVHLGTYPIDKLEEAIKVRKLAEIEYDYHPNHGRERTI